MVIVNNKKYITIQTFYHQLFFKIYFHNILFGINSKEEISPPIKQSCLHFISKNYPSNEKSFLKKN